MAPDPAKLTRVVVRAPGKVNLALRVGPRDEAGYHRLATVFQAVSLYEDVHAEVAEGFSVEVTGRHHGATPGDATNIALQAARLLADSTGVEHGAHLRIEKGVPVAGGMAGGSADAAAALVACDLLWGTGLARDELAELAAELGADVPFALTGLTAVGTGRGDILAPALARGEHHWVLALQDEGLSTPAVFSRWDELHPAPPDPELDEGLMAALLSGRSEVLAEHLANDLQEAACDLRPKLGEVLAAFADTSALAAIVSGSGPTVAALASTGPAARQIATTIREGGLASEVLVASGPVSGARVVEATRQRPQS